MSEVLAALPAVLIWAYAAYLMAAAGCLGLIAYVILKELGK